ncbi:gamma-tubulin complex component 2 homolog isoform X1 [Topomyia yanbarensis]|uniref:gamma-tubulin complex component 2 homolog isoform X1 n=1 Tax=Topomyia yanbarensis TaxID=2498891 RepID=UPI00273CD342|nr:gamma-tubulin complex component 2 homolog isoform X1 [Topomyia yanbarensis]
MSESKAKKILAELVKTSGTTYTVDNVLTFFRNKDGKYSTKRLSQLLGLIFKATPYGPKYMEEFTSSKQDTYVTLISILNNYSKHTQSVLAQLPSAAESVSKQAAMFESPPLSSTRIVPEQVTPENVQEIKEKIVQATIGSAINRSTGSIPSALVPQSFEYIGSRKGAMVSWNFNYEELYPMQNKNVAAIPLGSQEPIVLKELLNCLEGVKGSLIFPKKQLRSVVFCPVEFDVSDQIEESLRDIVREILPLASHYSQIQAFIAASSSLESGQILHALRAALQIIVNDYRLSITQLEELFVKQQLTFHKLLYFLRPVFHTMEVLAETVITIRQTNSRGGSVLTLLHDKITSTTGDEKSQKVLIHLLEVASVPYMEMLQLWILDGVIHDTRREFLIEHSAMDLNENELMDYWEKQYTVRLDKVPCFLNKYADVILRTGKYLNVIRECGSSADYQQQSIITLKYTHSDQTYIAAIENAYNFASSSLLNLIMNKYNLIGRLHSVKRYFLLQQGDFISQFMDACEEDLAKDVDNLRPMRLENLLEVTLNMSSARYDEYHDDLKTMLLPYGIVTQISKIVKKEDVFLDALGDTSQLKGIECFTFNYTAQWPVSIVLNRLTISKYQMIFRQLFYLKYVERMLCRVWIANNRTKQFASQTAKLYRSAFTLRQKMLIAIQNFESYMMIEVIEPNWHIFYQNIKQIKNIDDVLNYHQDFLDQCMKNCMLTDADLLKSIINLCNICLQFCSFLAEAQRHFVDAELCSMLASTDEFSLSSESDYDFACQQDVTTSIEPTETFSARVENYRTEFTNQLMSLLRKITEIATQNPSEKFINLIHRINFNSYYSDNFDS